MEWQVYLNPTSHDRNNFTESFQIYPDMKKLDYSV